MSNFYQSTKQPVTGEIEIAAWLDDYFGRHKYGIQFADGQIFREQDLRNEKPRLKASEISRKDRLPSEKTVEKLVGSRATN